MSKHYGSFVGTPIEFEAPQVPRREQVGPGKFARVARALWPRKTAIHLAVAAGVTPRAAKHWLAGDRKPSAEAIHAIVNEMLS